MPRSHSFGYARLTELRLQARAVRTQRISSLSSASGRRWDMPLADADVARAQARSRSRGWAARGVCGRRRGYGRQRNECSRWWLFLSPCLSGPDRHDDDCADGDVAAQRLRSLALPAPRMIAAAGLSLREPDGLASICSHGCQLGLASIGSIPGVDGVEDSRESQQQATTRTPRGSARNPGGVRPGSRPSRMGSTSISVHQSARSLTAVVVWPIAFAAALAMLSRPDLPVSGPLRRYSPGSSWRLSGIGRVSRSLRPRSAAVPIRGDQGNCK